MMANIGARLAIAGLTTCFTVAGLIPGDARAANHREAPITAKDRVADITDWFAFRSYDPGKEHTITMIMNVDPLLEPGNGPNYFPFDPAVTYRMFLDNNQDAVPDLVWEFEFQTEVRLPTVFTGFIGAGDGLIVPDNAPAEGTVLENDDVGDTLIPPAIRALVGNPGLSYSQTYTVTVLDGSGNTIAGPFSQGINADGESTALFAVPSNVGPRTTPDYDTELAPRGVYTLENGLRVFAGTVDDPFYIDLGAAFDTLNLPVAILESDQDRDGMIIDGARDEVSGYNVNTIALEVPIIDVTRGYGIPAADTLEAVVGTYAATFRDDLITPPIGPGGGAVMPDGGSPFSGTQVARMGNPLINELIIGTGWKDSFSLSPPVTDGRFADGEPDPPDFLLDPPVARALNAAFGIPVPDPPRTDLIPLVRYAPPICPACSAEGTGPIADLLRLNVGVAPAAPADASRLGVLSGDLAGHPNGRRVFDDVTDIFFRVGAGVLTGTTPFNSAPNNQLGDGVNRNDLLGPSLTDRGFQTEFPYVAFAQNGRDSRHVDRGEPISLADGGGDGDDDGGNTGKGRSGDGGGCTAAGSSGVGGAVALALSMLGLALIRRSGRKRVVQTAR